MQILLWKHESRFLLELHFFSIVQLKHSYIQVIFDSSSENYKCMINTFPNYPPKE